MCFNKISLIFILVKILLSITTEAFVTQSYTGEAVKIIDKKVGTKFIDLTHAFNNHTVVWPGRKITIFKEWEGRDENGIWSASYGFCTSEHTSTHLDAPFHFNKNGRRLNEIPFEDLIDVPGVMIDIYDKVNVFQDGKLMVNENYGLTREDVLEWEEIHGPIPQGAVVLLRTGWDARWGNPKLFLGQKVETVKSKNKRVIRSAKQFVPGTEKEEDEAFSEEPEEAPVAKELLHSFHTEKPVSKRLYDPAEAASAPEPNFPGFDVSAAKYLAEERAVRGVGADVISIDPGNQHVMNPAHSTFAGRNIYMMEMVANLHMLPPRGFNLWMVPFKIDRGTAAPTRVIARLNDNS